MASEVGTSAYVLEAAALLTEPTGFASYLSGVDDAVIYNPLHGGSCPLHEYLASCGYGEIHAAVCGLSTRDFQHNTPISVWAGDYQVKLIEAADERRVRGLEAVSTTLPASAAKAVLRTLLQDRAHAEVERVIGGVA